MKVKNALRNCRWTRNAAVLAMAILIAAVRSSLAQGNPDIIWQGQHAGYIRYTTFSRDWQFIASSVSSGGAYGTQTRSIALFKSDGSQVWQNSSAGGGATVFSPDGQLIASIGFAGIDILKTSDGTVLRTIVGPRGASLAISPDGQILASTGGAGGSFQWDDTIKIYRVSDGALVRTFTGTGVVTSIVFTPDSQTVIASSWDQNYDPINGYVPS